MVRVEFFARWRVDGNHLVALQRRGELTQGGLRTFADLLDAAVFDGQARFKAVCHGQQALGKCLHGKFAGLADFVFSAAAGVLHVGLGTQVLVLQLGHFGLERGRLCQCNREGVGTCCRIGFIGGLGGFDFLSAGIFRNASGQGRSPQAVGTGLQCVGRSGAVRVLRLRARCLILFRFFRFRHIAGNAFFAWFSITR